MTDKSDDLYLPYSVIMRIIRDAVSHVEHLKFQLELLNKKCVEH